MQLLGDGDKPVGPQVLLTVTSGSGSGSNATPKPTPDPADFEVRSRVQRQNELSKQGWYRGLVLLAFIGVLAAFVGTIVRGILRSRSTFRNPLGLPVGSLRAILAYTLVAFLGFYVLTSLLTISVFAPPDFLLGIVATVVGFYFGSRSDEEGGAADQRAGIVRGIVRKDTSGSGTPVSGALVKFKRESDSTELYSRLTDVDGRFVLQGAKPGKYKVSATTSGPAASGQTDINITEGSDQEIEIVIKNTTSAGAGGATGGQGGGGGTGYAVKGKVVQSDGTTPIAGVNVALSQGGVEKGKAKSGQDGSYTIDKKVEAGKYKLVASAAGFADITLENVEVKAGQDTTVPDLKMNSV